MTDELKPKRRGTRSSAAEAELAEPVIVEKRKEDGYVSPKRVQMEEPPPIVDDPQYLKEVDARIAAGEDVTHDEDEEWVDVDKIAANIFDEPQPTAADTVAVDVVKSVEPLLTKINELLGERAAMKPASEIKPPSDAMIQVQGGADYLPARYRVLWMRKQAETRGWGIQTELVEHKLGTFVSANRRQVKVEGGFAMFRATVIDNDRNVVIGQGTAVEWSDNFGDYVEKAETSAIARALAIAGFGTESALDLDEGWIADAPVKDGTIAGTGDVVIGSSEVAGVRQGGRQSNATQIQIKEIKNLCRDKDVAPVTLGELMVNTLPPERVAELVSNVPQWTNGVTEEFAELSEAERAKYLLWFLESLPFEECGRVITALRDYESDQ